MFLVVLIASACVGRLSAVPALALTWVVPAVLIGAGDEQIAKAILLAPLAALGGLGVRAGIRRLRPRTVTARA
jgi:hypothetical protein